MRLFAVTPTALLFFGLCTACNAAEVTGSSLPPYPPFSIHGEKAGGPGETRSSNADGVAVISNGVASFHSIALTLNWDDQKLAFEYKCRFNATASHAIVTSPTVDDDEECPPGGRPASNGISAIKVNLVGTVADKYMLRVTCTLAHQGQGQTEQLDPVGKGQWCGRETGNSLTEWLSTIKVEMHRD